MIIYFAHPIVTYFTQREQTALDYIRNEYPDAQVINPSKYSISPKKFKFKFYLDRVLKADTFIFITLSGNIIGKGIHDELKFARKKNKSIYFLTEAGEFIDYFTIHKIPTSSWQRYARVKVMADDQTKHTKHV